MTRPVTDGGAPKVLLITRNFPPLRGGMERLNERMFHSIHRNEPLSTLVGPTGCASHVPPGAKVAEVPTVLLPLTIVSGLIRGLSFARRLRPSIVLAGSGLTAPAAVASASICGAVPAVYLHGLDIIAPSWIYRFLWLPCIRRCQRVLVNSRNTRRLAIEAGVDAGRIRIVHPGTDLPSLDPGARLRFRRRYGIDEEAMVLLSVGRLSTRKGIAEFVDRSLPSILAVHPTAKLVIIGGEATDALHPGSGAGLKRIRNVGRVRGVEDAIEWLGPCSDTELSDAYQGADLHVFPVREIPGDVEGFGMVAIEAAAHGLLTVAFDVGGVSDAVVQGQNGSLVPSGDYDAFARVAANHLDAVTRRPSERAVRFAQQFGWERFGREVAAALEGHQ